MIIIIIFAAGEMFWELRSVTEDDVLSVDLSGVKNSPKVFFCAQVPFPIDQILYRVAFVKTKN